MSEAAVAPLVRTSQTEELFGASSTGKIGMWVFLIADALSFAGLLIGYGMLRVRSTLWHQPGEPELSVAFAALLTLVLLSSAFSMAMALRAAVGRDRTRLLFFLGLTALGGVLFLLGQWHEYGLLTHEGLLFGESAYASTFYVITGFHGLHVMAGVVYMLVVVFRAAGGKYDGGDYREVELVDLFWHFVGLVWVFVFTFIYLVPSHVVLAAASGFVVLFYFMNLRFESKALRQMVFLPLVFPVLYALALIAEAAWRRP